MAFNRTYNAGNVDQSHSYAAIPAGEYNVRIVVSEDRVSKSSGKDMIALELEIIDGPFSGRKLFQYIVDDQYADQKIYDICQSCRKEIPQTITSAVFRGLTGRVKTKQSFYNGEPKAEINYWIRPKGDAAPHPPVDPAMGPDAAAPQADDIPF